MDKGDDGLTGRLSLVASMTRPPLKCEQMHETAVELQRGAADRVGVDAEFLPEADGGEAVA